jgi:SynChlorMet cassette radical SAM/SPASM protein ScmE
LKEVSLEKSYPDRHVLNTPRHVDIEITSQCNLRCRYCYFFNVDDHVTLDLPTGTWLKFFRELKTLTVLDVTIAGGEPFIRSDIREILDGVAANRMRYTLLSNGGLITDDIAHYLAAGGRCDSVQVSIDGSSPDTHDCFRGKGAFDGAVRGIRILQKHGIDVDVRYTLHHKNVHDIAATADFLLNTLNLQGFSVNNAGYFGSCSVFADDIKLTVEDKMTAMAELLKASLRYPGRITATAGPLAEARMWRSMIDLRDRHAAATAGTLSACGCMFEKISILSDGTIVPCNLLPNIKLGNILTHSLKDVWLNSPELDDLRRRHTIPLDGFAMCRDCSFRPYCTGNCPGLAYPLTGEVNHPSPEACLKLFLESGGQLPE